MSFLHPSLDFKLHLTGPVEDDSLRESERPSDSENSLAPPGNRIGHGGAEISSDRREQGNV